MAELKERIEIGKHMVMDPKICHGALTFKGTRVIVGVVMEAVIRGQSLSDLRRGWPRVSEAAFREMLRHAKKSLLASASNGHRR